MLDSVGQTQDLASEVDVASAEHVIRHKVYKKNQVDSKNQIHFKIFYFVNYAQIK